jgi:response regulator RpfG family c-di-GMP phosphodiesterase
MLTAVSGEADEHTGFAAGVDDYVVKPFRNQDLLDRVRVWLRARHRFKAAQERLLENQQRLRELEQQALREQLAQDEAVLAMARTASDQLNQPLAALLGWVELWETDEALQQDPGPLREKIKTAADHLAARIHAVTHAVRYTPTDVAGYIHVDIARAQEQEPGKKD